MKKTRNLTQIANYTYTIIRSNSERSYFFTFFVTNTYWFNCLGPIGFSSTVIRKKSTSVTLFVVAHTVRLHLLIAYENYTHRYVHLFLWCQIT